MGRGRADRIAWSEVLTRWESPSLESVTCDRPRKTLMRWGMMRVVTTGWRRVVTTRLAQDLAWGRALKRLQQLCFGWHRFGQYDRIVGAVGPPDRL